MSASRYLFAGGLALLACWPLGVSVPAGAEVARQLSPAELFGLADTAVGQGHYVLAEQAYRALCANRDPDLRTEARFRLALLLADRLHRYRDAAVELRRILDEKPGAARVRLELARIAALSGDLGTARRELRAAEAAGLPAEVERTVRFYAAALQARQPVGGSIEVALAPDSNINRATRSETLGTVIGNFTLDDDARARSGLGLAVRGQAYARAAIGNQASLFARVDGSAMLYRDAAFNDVILGVQAGPELRSGTDRLSLTAGPTWRWYAGDPYSTGWSGEGVLLHPVGRRGQARLALGLGRTVNRRNALQTGTTWSASAALDRAFTARLGGGLALAGSRTSARDPGWSDASGSLSGYVYREMGHATAVVSLGYSRLEADARLALFPRRRMDDRFSAAAAITWRGLRWHGLAPVTRLRWERNRSTVELYAYRRLAAEIGVASAF